LARREAPACRKARAIGLRLSARHPLGGAPRETLFDIGRTLERAAATVMHA
jgi:hypothetical protein